MVEMPELFAALADPGREAMVRRLSMGSATVGELGEGLGLAKSTITKHLDVLESACVIARQREGRTVVCTLREAPLTQIADWLTDRWEFFT